METVCFLLLIFFGAVDVKSAEPERDLSCAGVFIPSDEIAIRLGKQLRLSEGEAKTLSQNAETKSDYLAIVGARQLIHNGSPKLWESFAKALMDPKYSPQSGDGSDLFSRRFQLVDDVFEANNVAAPRDVRMVVTESLLRFPIIRERRNLSESSVLRGVERFLETEKISGADFNAFIQNAAKSNSTRGAQITVEQSKLLFRFKNKRPTGQLRVGKGQRFIFNRRKDELKRFSSSPDLASYLKSLAKTIFERNETGLRERLANQEPIEDFVRERISTFFSVEKYSLNDHTLRFLTRVVVYAVKGGSPKKQKVTSPIVKDSLKRHLLRRMGQLASEAEGERATPKRTVWKAPSPQQGQVSQAPKREETTFRPAHNRRKRVKKGKQQRKENPKPGNQEVEMQLIRLQEFDRDLGDVDSSISERVLEKLELFVAAQGQVSQRKWLSPIKKGDSTIGEIRVRGKGKVRIYFAVTGPEEYVVLRLGTKEDEQNRDIEKARERLKRYFDSQKD